MAQPGPISDLDTRAFHRDKMAGLGELTAGIAHELNNPVGYISSNLNALRRYADTITALIAQAELFMDEPRRGEWRAVLAGARWDFIHGDLTSLIDETREGAEHLKSVVGDLKALARTSISTEQASLDQCVSSALGVLTHQLKHRYVVERALAAGDSLTMVRSQLIQLVINLVHNAIQALGTEGGRIRITTTQADGRTVLVIEDAGPGIPVELRPDIFTPFFTTKTNGTGLGLPIVARIAANHGGTVVCDSSPELGGARFTVTLGHWLGTGTRTA
jgi:signal transduction histidine kinase